VRDGAVTSYIGYVEGGGFCLCGADDLVLPVYFYSPDGTFERGNPDLEYVLEEIGKRAEEHRRLTSAGTFAGSETARALTDRARFWQDLIKGTISEKASSLTTSTSPSRVVLPLTTQWNQTAPYNNFCPVGAGGDRTVVGCVATATAQIMKYWEWPPQGTNGGMLYRQWNGDDSCPGIFGWGANLTILIGDPYDWANMPDRVWTTSPQAQKDAVAELSYEVGFCLNMDWGVCSSSSYTSWVPSTLASLFDYDNDARWDDGRDVDRMTAEIQWLRPVEMQGRDSSGSGHAWVVYGYDTSTDPDRQFAMNLGWGGSCDGWYSYDSVPLDLTRDQGQATKLAPKSAVRFVGSDVSGDGSPGSPYLNIEAAVANAPDGTTLILKAGSDNVLSALGPLAIDRPMRLRGYGVTIRKQN
jgi:peptidase C10-like protein